MAAVRSAAGHVQRVPRTPRTSTPAVAKRRRCAAAGAGGEGVLAAPGLRRPAVLQRVGQPPEGTAPGRSLRSPAAIAYGTLHRGETVEQQTGLGVAFLGPQTQMTAEHSEPGAAEAEHRGGEATPVQSWGSRQQDVLGTFHRGTQRAEQQRPGGGGSATRVTRPVREASQAAALRQRKKRGASWARTRSGSQARITRASASRSSRIERML